MSNRKEKTTPKDRHSNSLSAASLSRTGRLSRTSGTSRTQSVSPQKKQTKQPLHIRLNLTESQMDKITDAFTSRVEGSPPKGSHRRNKYSLDSSTIEEASSSGSMPPRESSLSGTLADRRQGTAPAPIIVTNQRGPVVAPRRVSMEDVDDGVSPLSPRQMYEAGRAGYQTASSAYSSTDEPSTYWQSANMQRASRTVDPFYTVPNDLQRQEASPERKLGSPIKMAQRDETHASDPLPSALWSPFPFYFRGRARRTCSDSMVGWSGLMQTLGRVKRLVLEKSWDSLRASRRLLKTWFVP